MTTESLKIHNGQDGGFLHVHVGSFLDKILRDLERNTTHDQVVIIVQGKYYLVDMSQEHVKYLVPPEYVGTGLYQSQTGHRVPKGQEMFLGNVNGFEYSVREISPEEARQYSRQTLDITQQVRHSLIQKIAGVISSALGK